MESLPVALKIDLSSKYILISVDSLPHYVNTNFCISKSQSESVYLCFLFKSKNFDWYVQNLIYTCFGICVKYWLFSFLLLQRETAYGQDFYKPTKIQARSLYFRIWNWHNSEQIIHIFVYKIKIFYYNCIKMT